ncbi:hypothetical protein BH683_007710 [Williamsia sp. 1138]|uniref:Pycsar system effector family protein n=1 Tax=Williamsia sp. 1138 TaxID=1903117 RepID=UPI000A10BC12|nr:Pycsar system effector family protein [Williamsia sp. 1138]OZG29803.1 hypothetical protein BH683_007710 [Williamsia sp. 1138]
MASDPVDTAWKIHAAVVDWTGKVDSKASFTLTIQTAIMAGIITMSTDNRVLADLSGPKEIFYTIGVVLVGLAMLGSAAVVIPQLRRSKTLKTESSNNFIYFGHLRHLDPADIERQIKNADLLPVLSHQLQVMSNIAWWKHRLAQASMILAILGIIPIVIVALV